jgi:FMN phosphatase YigB (HAD superfamily)
VANENRFPILNPSIEKTVKELKEQGIIVGIISAHPMEALEKELDYFGIRELFEFVEGDITDKSIRYREKASELGLSPHNVVIIDDMPDNGVHGMQEGVGVVIKRGGYSSDEVIYEWSEDARAKEYPHIVIKDVYEFVEMKDWLENSMIEHFSGSGFVPFQEDIF